MPKTDTQLVWSDCWCPFKGKKSKKCWCYAANKLAAQSPTSIRLHRIRRRIVRYWLAAWEWTKQ